MTRYDVIELSAEITMREIKKALSHCDIGEYESILIGLVLDKYYDANERQTYATKEEAMSNYHPFIGATRYSHNVPYYVVDCILVEEYEVDDDGEFSMGCNYDYTPSLSVGECNDIRNELFGL